MTTLLAALPATAAPPVVGVERLRARVLAESPHDPAAFTQGLLFHDGFLWESTGGYGVSTVRRVRVEDGVVEHRVGLDEELFGEGLARVGERLIQLTWEAGRAFSWSLPGLEPLGESTYSGEGWGLCHDGRRLVMSNGSSVLTFRDPETFEVTGRVPVTLQGRALPRLNELECAEGWVWANVWQTEELVRIDPVTGRVTAVVDASGLLGEAERRRSGVLNGIAHHPGRGTWFLTGKLWPKLFEVAFVAADGPTP